MTTWLIEFVQRTGADTDNTYLHTFVVVDAIPCPDCNMHPDDVPSEQTKDHAQEVMSRIGGDGWYAIEETGPFHEASEATMAALEEIREIGDAHLSDFPVILATTEGAAGGLDTSPSNL